MAIDIGVRELKRDLSGYLRRAAAGEAIRVTLRGEAIVELRPIAVDRPGVDPAEEQWNALCASGVVHRPLRAKEPVHLLDLGLEHDPLALILEERRVDR